MRILIVAATEFEIAATLRNKKSIDHVVTGIGSPATVYHLLKKLQEKKYDIIIQAGIAGSFTETLALGEVVFVTTDCFADLGISEQNQLYTIFEKGFADENNFPFSFGWLNNETNLPVGFRGEYVKALTVNTVTDNVEYIRQLQAKYKPDIETMEGAALHFVCLLEKIPFIQVRAISNYVGERNKENWKITDAIRNLNVMLDSLINFYIT